MKSGSRQTGRGGAGNSVDTARRNNTIYSNAVDVARSAAFQQLGYNPTQLNIDETNAVAREEMMRQGYNELSLSQLNNLSPAATSDYVRASDRVGNVQIDMREAIRNGVTDTRPYEGMLTTALVEQQRALRRINAIDEAINDIRRGNR